MKSGRLHCICVDNLNLYPMMKFWTSLNLKHMHTTKHMDSKIEIWFGKGKNNLGKGENAGYQHFHAFLMFSKAFHLRVIKVQDCMAKG